MRVRWPYLRRPTINDELVDQALIGMKDALDQRDFWQDRALRAERGLRQAIIDVAQLRQEVAEMSPIVTLHSLN